MSDIAISAIIYGILIGGVYSLIALGYVVIFKSSQIVSFVQGGILLTGATIAWALLDVVKLPIVLAIIVALIGCAIIGLAIERFTLRPIMGQPLLSSVMITVALLWLFDAIAVLTVTGAGRAFPQLMPSGVFQLGDVRISQAQLLCFVTAIILFIIFTVFYRYTKVGLAMRGTAEDHEVIQSLGIKVTNIFGLTWVIAALTAGIGGVLMASLLNLNISLELLGWKALIVILIGGLESITGAIIVGPFIGILETLSTVYIDPLVGGGMRDVIPFVVMIIVLLIRPYGLFGLKRIERI
jgi:branched-chain amino acid transport system permease protein